MLGIQKVAEENSIHLIDVTPVIGNDRDNPVDFTNLANDDRSLQTSEDFGGLLIEGGGASKGISILPWGDTEWHDFSVPGADPIVLDLVAISAIAISSTTTSAATIPTKVSLARKSIKVY